MRKLAFVALLGLSVFGVSQSGPSISVTPTLAPNAFGSPSYAAWVTNSFNAIDQGLSTYGTPGTPTYYQAQSVVNRYESIVTGFNSWKGVANPGAPYGSELGNRMLFGLHIIGNAVAFSIDNLKFAATSTGDANGLAFGFGYGSYNYSNDYVGIQYGGDNARGGGDDVLITSGPASQLVNELIGRGSGSSYDAYTTAGFTDQEVLNSVAEDPTKQWETFTGVYTLRGFTGGDVIGSGTFNAAPVPEPGTMIALGLGAVALLRRRKKA